MEIHVKDAKIVKREPVGFGNRFFDALKTVLGAFFALVFFVIQVPFMLAGSLAGALAAVPLILLGLLVFWVLIGLLLPLLFLGLILLGILSFLISKK